MACRFSILSTIGKKPVLELRKVVAQGSARVRVKLESQNPTGSMKDRMALAVVEGTVARGKLQQRGRVIEYIGSSTETWGEP